MGRYRAVVVGAGFAGVEMPQNHTQGYLEHPRTELAGLIDTSEERLEWLRLSGTIPPGVGLTSDLSFLSLWCPHLISIATPEKTHLEVFRRILGFFTPLGLFIEKPLATTVAGAREIAERSEELGISVQVNHARVWDLDVRRMPRPETIRYGGGPWRNDVHAHHLAGLYKDRPRVLPDGREPGLFSDSVPLWGRIRQNTMGKAISDLISAIEYGTEPQCPPHDAIRAIEATLKDHR